MPVDFLASAPHYWAHLAPVYAALEPAERGTVHTKAHLIPALVADGVPVDAIRLGPPGQGSDVVLVASFVDSRTVRRLARRPVVYLEHGAGQTYASGVAPHPSYSGGPEHDGTVAFLCPSEAVAARWRARYPAVPAEVVGSPRLDALMAVERRSHSPTVALAFHSEIALCPESRSAWRHYEGSLAGVVNELRGEGIEVLGHGHPRAWRTLARGYARAGIEAVPDFAEVVARADVLALDNSSVGPEAAACGLGLVWLNAPWYRREVHHGARYWHWTEDQVTCDGPSELVAAVRTALRDPLSVRLAREAMLASVYAHRDGRSAEGAVAAIRRVIGGCA